MRPRCWRAKKKKKTPTTHLDSRTQRRRWGCYHLGDCERETPCAYSVSGRRGNGVFRRQACSRHRNQSNKLRGTSYRLCWSGQSDLGGKETASSKILPFVRRKAKRSKLQVGLYLHYCIHFFPQLHFILFQIPFFPPF